MPVYRPLWLLGLLAAGVMGPGSARASQGPPPTPGGQPLTVAVVPAQYFTADADSAAKLTEGIRQEFASKGWTIMPADQVQQAWEKMGLKNAVHYPDRQLIDLGRQLNADLIVYPRLLALGIPIPAENLAEPGIEPAAVVHLRVLNVKRNHAIYFNQIAQSYKVGEPFTVAEFRLPAAVGQQASTKVLAYFFQAVAGSREVLAPEPPAPPARATRHRRGRGTRHRGHGMRRGGGMSSGGRHAAE